MRRHVDTTGEERAAFRLPHALGVLALLACLLAGGRAWADPPPPPPPPDWPDTEAPAPRPVPSPTPTPTPGPEPAPQPAPRPAPEARTAGPVVQRIEFEGNLLYADAVLTSRLRTKVGRPLDPALLDADMEELYRYFREIQVVEEAVPGGIVLRFRVRENPLVTQLEIRGNDELEDSEIREMLRTQEGYPLSPYHLAADREDVESAYRMRGYHFAQVTEPRVLTLPNGGRRVVLTVVEGPEVAVRRIVIRGNDGVPRKDILEVMRLEVPNVFEQIVGDMVFREDVLEEDIVAIKELYRRRGYLDAEVVLDDLRFSDDRSEVEISIAIDEHQVHRVGSIRFEIEREPPGEVASPTPEDVAWFTEERLQALLGVQPGQRYDGEAIAEGLDRIRDAYHERSYLNVAVGDRATGGPRVRGRENELVVDMVIPVAEGPKFRLARIDFVGNEFTRDKILRREVETAPGGYVDRRRLDEGLTAIRRLDYFDRATLQIDDAIGPDGEPLPGWKQATYEIVEGSTGNVSFGVSVGTNGGFAAQVRFVKRNFDIARWPSSFRDITEGRAWTGAGQEFDLLLNPGTRVSQFRARFREPRFFGSKFSFSTSLQAIRAFRESYEVDRKGYTIGFGYPLYLSEDRNVALRGDVSWRHELIDIEDIEPDAIPGAFLFAGDHELRSIGGSLNLRTRDDFRDPTIETRSQLAGAYTGGFLGGDIDIWAITGRHEATFLLHEDAEGKMHRLHLRGELGITESFGNTPEVPPYERFFAGGRTFRGFEFRGVGPHVNGEPTGGEFMLLSTIEYEFPLVARTLSMVVFSDQGVLETSIDDPWRWRVTAGVGVRFAIPFLLGRRPMALDFAWPIYAEDEDEESVFSFSLGRDL